MKEQRVFQFQPLNQGTGWLQGETETGVQVVGEPVYDSVIYSVEYEEGEHGELNGYYVKK